MIIYRVEHVDNPRRGVFTTWHFKYPAPIDSASDAAEEHDVINPGSHPVPYCDGIDQFTRQHHCGMPSLDAYRTWFAHPAVRAALYESGEAHLRVYDVPDHLVLKGMLQVMFNPDDATSSRVATPEERQ